MTTTGLLVDISDPGGGDCGGSIGPLNLRRGRNSLASHPKTLEEEDDPFGLLDRAKETRTGAVVNENIDDETPVGTLIAIDRQPARGSIGSSAPFHHVTTPSSCLQDSVFSPSQDSQTSDEPNWDQLQSDAQSVASSCSEQPSLSSIPSVSSFTPASHLKMEMELDSPLALLNLSKEDSFLVALTPDKPPTTSLVDEMSKMAIKVQDEVEPKAPKQEEASTTKVDAREVTGQIGGKLNKGEEGAEPKTPKNKQADIKALKRRLSAIKENRDPAKPSVTKTTGSEAKPLGRKSLLSVQPRQSLGLTKSRQGCDPPDVEVQKTGSSALSKVSQRKPALLKLSQMNKAPVTPSSLKSKTPLISNKNKQATAMAPPPQEKVKSVRGRGMPLPANPSNHQPATVGVEPNLSPSISESGLSEVTSSPLGPPQASSSTPLRKGQLLTDVVKDVKADPKMPQLKGSATSRFSQYGQVKPRSFSTKPPSATISKPTRPEMGQVKPKDSLNSSIQNMRKQSSVKTTIGSSLNTTGPSSFSAGETPPKKVGSPMLRPPLSRLRPPNSGLRPPSTGLKPPSVGLRTENLPSTPKMRPPSSSAIKPPSASLSRQGLSSTAQSRIRSSLPSPQVLGPMHSTPRRNLQTPVRSQR